MSENIKKLMATANSCNRKDLAYCFWHLEKLNAIYKDNMPIELKTYERNLYNELTLAAKNKRLSCDD